VNWLNIELPTLRSEEYLGSDPVQRATWLNLLAYCADQENGGVIKDCHDWGGRRWLQLIGVTSDEVLSSSDLWEWKNNALHVWSYPKAKELEVKRKREQGKKGGRPPKIKGDKPHGSPDSKPHGSILQKRNRKGIGKEEEGNTLFERVWVMYRRKGTKQKALQYWDKLSADDHKAIESAIPAYIASCSEIRYQKNFEGWINPANRMWENEIVTDEPQKKSGEIDSIEDLKKMGYKFDD